MAVRAGLIALSAYIDLQGLEVSPCEWGLLLFELFLKSIHYLKYKELATT